MIIFLLPWLTMEAFICLSAAMMGHPEWRPQSGRSSGPPSLKVLKNVEMAAIDLSS